MILCDRCREKLSVPRAQHNIALTRQKDAIERVFSLSEWIHLCDECEVIAADQLRALVEDIRREVAEG